MSLRMRVGMRGAASAVTARLGTSTAVTARLGGSVWYGRAGVAAAATPALPYQTLPPRRAVTAVLVPRRAVTALAAPLIQTRMRKLIAYFLRGLIVTAPVALTLYIGWNVF